MYTMSAETVSGVHVLETFIFVLCQENLLDLTDIIVYYEEFEC